MAATIDEAYYQFSSTIQNALHCVTPAKLGSWRPPLDQPHVLTFQHAKPVPVQRNTGLRRLFLGVTLHYRIVDFNLPADPRGPYRLIIDGYTYALFDNHRAETLAFHWERDPHPGSRAYPHLHVGSTVIDTGHALFGSTFSSLHIPTGWITIEHIVRFLIEDLDVIPNRSDWDDTLQRTQTIRKLNRDWA